MSSRFIVLCISALIVAAGSGSTAAAHDLRGVVKLPPDAVIVEATFSDGTPARGATVTITNAENEEVATGKTDDRGICTLPKLGPGTYTAVVESIGHRDAIVFPVLESSSFLEFSNPRLNAALGVGIGVAALLAVAGGFWLMRRVSERNSLRRL